MQLRFWVVCLFLLAAPALAAPQALDCQCQCVPHEEGPPPPPDEEEPPVEPPPPPPVTMCDGDCVPADHGMIVVTQHPSCPGIVGDGVADDTAALQACMRYWSSHRKNGTLATEAHETLVFPKDKTFKISDTLRQEAEEIDPVTGLHFERVAQTYRCLSGAKFVLAPNSPGFGDPNVPKTVWKTGNPSPGGSALQNHMKDCTFEIGAGNPGAVAIQHAGNNMNSVRGVKIVAAPGSCKTGFSLNDKWPGPMVVDGLDVTGCDHAVQFTYPYANVTFRNLKLRDQRVAGVDLYRSHATFLDTDSNQTLGAPAFTIRGFGGAPGGLVTILGGNLVGTGPAAAVRSFLVTGENASGRTWLFARGVTTSGYAKALDHFADQLVTMPAQYTSIPAEIVHPASSLTSLGLAVPAHPHKTHSNPADWVNARAFLPDPNDPNALLTSAAVQAAIDSPACPKVVYLGGTSVFGGSVQVSDTIRLRNCVERIVGYDTVMGAVGDSMKASATNPTGKRIFSMEADHAVELENINADRGDRFNSPFPHPRTVHSGSGALIMTNVLHLTNYESLPGAGPLFVENACCDRYRLLSGNSSVLISPNVEAFAAPLSGDATGRPDIELTGGDHVIVGFKTEGNDGPFLKATNSRLESWGAWHYSSIQNGNNSPGPIWELIESQALIQYDGLNGVKWDHTGCVTRNGQTGDPDGCARNTVPVPLNIRRQLWFLERP